MTLGHKTAPIKDLPDQIEFSYGIWGKVYDMDGNKISIFVFEQAEGMEEYGFFFIQKGTMTVPIYWEGLDPTNAQVAALRKEITKIRGEAEAKANEIQGQINRLLSITLDTKGR